MDSLRSLLCYPWCLETMTEKQQTAFVLDTYWGWDVFQYALQQLCQSWYNLNHQRWWKNLWEKQMNTARKLVCVVCKCPLLWTFQYLLISGMMLLAHSPPPTGKSTLKANFISCVYLIFQNNPLEVLSRGNKANSAADIQLVTYLDLLIKGFGMNPFFFFPLYIEKIVSSFMLDSFYANQGTEGKVNEASKWLNVIRMTSHTNNWVLSICPWEDAAGAQQVDEHSCSLVESKDLEVDHRAVIAEERSTLSYHLSTLPMPDHVGFQATVRKKTSILN